MFNFWTAALPRSSIAAFGLINSSETYGYSIFMAPVGLGNLLVGYMRAPSGSISMAPLPDDVVLPVHLVIVDPSNVTLVNADVITPYSVQIDFDKRGEYVVYVTNQDDKSSAIPIGVEFIEEDGVTHREADKFLVGTILTVSGVVLSFLGLGISLIAKHKKTDVKTVALPNIYSRTLGGS
ncbi:MAG: hypothetical protein LBC12_00910 [Nitrososphaerota archaeon]|nr:hypothetical protein [Nitrososphaerota archaeon]